MTAMQYLGQDYTLLALPGESVKTKVSHGEIIEVSDAKVVSRLQLAGFQVVETATKTAEEIVETPKKKK